MATSSAVIEPMPIAQRGPYVWPIQPTIGDPMGVAPRNTIMYNAITRPRTAGSVVIWMVELAAVIMVRLASPTGMHAIT